MWIAIIGSNKKARSTRLATIDGKLLLDFREYPHVTLGVSMLDEKGRPLEGQYSLNKEDYYQARIPQAALAGSVRELTLTWVDVYRR